MSEQKEYVPLTHEELVAEAIALIQRASYNDIEKALKAAMEVGEVQKQEVCDAN